MYGDTRAAYLAGGIEDAGESGASWRQEIARWLEQSLGHRVFDPHAMSAEQLLAEERESLPRWKEADLPLFQRAVRKIIHHDLRVLLEHTDYVVCRCCASTPLSAATQGELTMAYWHQIPIYLKVDIPRTEISSWILGCATHVFEKWEDLKKAVETQYSRDPASS